MLTKQTSNRRMAYRAMILFLFLVAGGELLAQNFENNNAGVYTAGTNGIIRMRATNGQFTTTAGGADIGRNAATRIQGRVEWSSIVAAQNVQARYYTDLYLTGGASATKNVPDAVYVYKAYNPSAASQRTYVGTFHYDRDVAADDQIIYPENGSAGTGSYNNLDLIGAGTKTVAYLAGVGGEVKVNNSFTSIAGVTARVYDDMYINVAGGTATVDGPVIVGDGTNNGNFYTGLGAANFSANVSVASGTFNIDGVGAGTFGGTVQIDKGSFNLTAIGTGNATMNGAVNVNNGGSYNLKGAGNATFAGAVAVATGGSLVMDNGVTGQMDVNGSLALGNGATALLSIGSNDKMLITGSFTNAFDARTNMTFADGSTVTYDGADGQAVMTTVSSGTNSYANLTITAGGTKVPVNNATSPDINVRGNFDLGASGITTLAMGNAPVFAMTNGTALYNNNRSEVTGKFRRSGVSTGTNYNYNNLVTIANFGVAPGAGGYFQLDIKPGTNPNIQAPTAPAVDVQRKITATSANGGAGSYAELASLELGYLTTEYTGTQESRMRMLEGDGGDRNEKILAGIPIALADRNLNGSGPGGWSTIKIQGTNNPPDRHYLAMLSNNTRGEFWEIGQGHDIVLTDQRGYLISVRNGRWSADNTWDEGRPPMHDEDALVRHIVYTGIDNGPFGSTATTRDEDDPTIDPIFSTGSGSQVLCNSVALDVIGARTGSNVSLLIGNADNTMNANFINIFGDTGPLNGVFNNNTTLGTAWDENFASYNNLQGIHVLTPSGVRIPAMRASQLTNAGRVNNNSVIEIGQ